MDFLKQNKAAVLGGVLVLLVGYVYFAYFSGSSSAPLLSSSDASVTLSQNLLVTLQNLHTIKLDNSIFTMPTFQSLTDFGVVIPPQNVGRRNPFIPIAGSQSVPNSTIVLPGAH